MEVTQEKEKGISKVTVGEHCYYMDGYLKSNLDILKKHIKSDWDFVILISSGGLPGPGKTTIAQQICKYLDPSFDLSRIVFEGEKFKHVAMKLKPYQAILYDEGRAALDSKKWSGAIQRNLMDFFSECRMLNLFIVILLPDFFELKKEVALNRSVCLIDIYCRESFKRSYFTFHNRETKKNLYIFGRDRLEYTKASPKFRGRFTDYWVVSKIAYNNLKRKSIKEKEETTNINLRDDWLKGAVKTLKQNLSNLSYTELANLVSENCNRPISRQSVARLLGK